MRRRVMTRVRVALAVLLGSTLLAGCDFDVYSLPLPGGTDVGDDPMTVYVEFEDVLDLVPQSSVKVNDVSVGRVSEVELDGQTALVTLQLRNDVDLPEDTIASIRQTSLLGEKFVSLEPPAGGGDGELGDEDTITLERTGRNPEVEEVLGALSLVLNGGGVAQLKTITSELNLALEGREDSARSVLTQVESLMSQLDDRKADIVDAIESINRLAVGVRRHQTSIDRALDQLPSALQSINRQRTDLVRMLRGLNRLGDVGVRVIRQTKEVTVSTLRHLEPILTQVGNAGDSFVNAAHVFFTYPFIDEVVGRDPQVARNLHQGDYVNLAIEMNVDLGNLVLPDVACIPLGQLPNNTPLDELVDLKNLCAGVTKVLQSCVKTPPDLEACLRLPEHLLDEVCEHTALPQLCDLVPIGGLGGNQGGSGGQTIEDLLDSVGGALGLPRTAPMGTTGAPEESAPLSATYDPTLVALLAGPVIREGSR